MIFEDQMNSLLISPFEHHIMMIELFFSTRNICLSIHLNMVIKCAAECLSNLFHFNPNKITRTTEQMQPVMPKVQANVTWAFFVLIEIGGFSFV